MGMPAVDGLGNQMYELFESSPLGWAVGGFGRGWHGINALPDRETRKPIWIEGQGWRINRANGSPAPLTSRENQWWGITPDSVDQRLETERIAKGKQELGKQRQEDRAWTLETIGIQQAPQLKALEAEIAGLRQQGALQLEELRQRGEAQRASDTTANRGITEGVRQFDLNRTDAAAALQARNALDERRLGMEEQVMLGNMNQRDFENQMMLYLHAQKNADAERARIAGIADSLTRAFASLKF